MADLFAQPMKLLTAGKRDEALARLVTAWQDRPLPELAELIDALNATVPRDGDDLARLREGTIGDIGKRIEKLRRHGRDPRLATQLFALLRDVPFTSSGSRPTWTIVFAALDRLADPRQLAGLESIAAGWGIRENQRAWLAPRVDALAAALRAKYPGGPPKPSSGELAALEKLRGLVGGAPRKQATGAHSAADMLAEIYASPDDDGPRAVYADWLQEQRDLADVERGEFIASQLAARRDDKMLAREAALIAKHGRTWLGPLAPVVLEKGLEFARGFVSACHVRFKNERDVRAHGKHAAWATVEQLSHSVPGAPPADQLRWLYYIDPAMGSLREVNTNDDGVAVLCDAPAAWRLETLSLVIRNGASLERLRTTELLPRLRALRFRSPPPRGWLARSRFAAQLRELALIEVGWDVADVGSWVGEVEALPALEELELNFGNWKLTRDADRQLSVLEVERPTDALPTMLAADVLTEIVFARDPGRAPLAQPDLTRIIDRARHFTRLRRLDLRALGGEDIALASSPTRRKALPTPDQLPLGEIRRLAWPARGRLVAEGKPGLIWLDAERTGSRRVVEGGSSIVAADGTRVVAFDGDGDCKLFDAQTGAVLANLDGVSAGTDTGCFSSDGARLAVLDGKQLQVFDATTGAVLARRGGIGHFPRQVAWHGDGRRLVISTQGPTMLVEPDTRKRPIELDPDEAYAIAVATDGRIALGPWNEGHVRLRDAAGAELARWPSRGQVRSLAFVDGALVIFSEDEGVKLQPLDRKKARTLVPQNRTAHITAVALGPRNRLAIARAERLEIWPLEGGKPIVVE